MKIYREIKVITEDLQVGDQIKVKLKGFGKFTATLQQIDSEGFIFMFDQCIAEKAMNETDTNEGGYDASDLRKWLDSSVINAFPKKLRKRIGLITLPSAEQIFGPDKLFFPLMKKRKNRTAFFKDDPEWYWLRNATKKDFSATTGFVCVTYFGNADGISASDTYIGVRPIFLIKRKDSKDEN